MQSQSEIQNYSYKLESCPADQYQQLQNNLGKSQTFDEKFNNKLMQESERQPSQTNLIFSQNINFICGNQINCQIFHPQNEILLQFNQKSFNDSINEAQSTDQKTASTDQNSSMQKSKGQVQCQLFPDHSIMSQQLRFDLNKSGYYTSKYSTIMKQRFLKLHEYLPQVDRVDIYTENPLFNGGIIPKFRHQHNPEYSQACFMKIRQLEESSPTYDYMNPQKNYGLYKILQEIEQNPKFKWKKKKIMSQNDRSYGIQKIYDLHQQKNYKIETLFAAISVFDRYLMSIGHWNFQREDILKLTLVSLLIAAKLQQQMQPCFQKMINLLEDKYKNEINVEKLVDLESDVLVRLGFDFNYQSPNISMERFLRILDLDQNKIIYDMSFQICKFQLNDSKFLQYRPSQIAACSVIISINIYRKDFEELNKIGIFSEDQNHKGESFFDISQKKCEETDLPLLKLNLQIWNQKYIKDMTGYTIEMIQECLKELVVYIQQNLQPDRLQRFDLEF